MANTNGAQLYRISNPLVQTQVYSQHNVDTAAGTCTGGMGQQGGMGGDQSSRNSGDFGEESLRSDQASQEEWDSDSGNSELDRDSRSQRDFGSNGE